MSSESGDIIIKGGSVEVQFDESVYQKDPADPLRYKSETRKIVRIRITGDIEFDSGNIPNGLRCSIEVLSR